GDAFGAALQLSCAEPVPRDAGAAHQLGAPGGGGAEAATYTAAQLGDGQRAGQFRGQVRGCWFTIGHVSQTTAPQIPGRQSSPLVRGILYGCLDVRKIKPPTRR